MKITAYEVRPDEKDYLLAAAQQEQNEKEAAVISASTASGVVRVAAAEIH